MNVERHIFSYSCGEETVCVSTTAISLPDLLNKFAAYIKACGYVFDGEVTICDGKTCPHVVAPDDLDPTEDGKEGV